MTVWIVCQLGAREHYAVPRALHQGGQLHTLITDSWMPSWTPSWMPSWMPSHNSSNYRLAQVVRKLGDRYHPALAHASVHANTSALIAFELNQRLARHQGWTRVIARNHWFAHRALHALKRLEKQLSPNERPILFSYSYTALPLFRYAKARGWQTVLGQIDPGLAEQTQVAQLQARYGAQYASTWEPAPDRYWDNWRQECQLADRILVNSAWSQQSLVAEGICENKLAIAPLAYSVPPKAKDFKRQYPSKFTADRPLRVLFLGQIILRKGVAALIEAIAHLSDHPIEIWLVGSTELDPAWALRQHPQLKWLGAVPRRQVSHYYQQADVFLFPTHSDGFGLTQLEAQAWKLPLIASRHCGEVVTHQQNGLRLSSICAQSIAAALLFCCQHPDRLQQWSGQSINMNRYNLPPLAKTLQSLTDASI